MQSSAELQNAIIEQINEFFKMLSDKNACVEFFGQKINNKTIKNNSLLKKLAIIFKLCETIMSNISANVICTKR